DLRAVLPHAARAAVAVRPRAALSRHRRRPLLALAVPTGRRSRRAAVALDRAPPAGADRGLPALQLPDADRGAARGAQMSVLGSLSQLLEIVVALLLAPLLVGWVNQWRAWLQNKSAPPLLQPYRVLHKLFNKESVVAHHASSLFRSAPYVVFSCMLLASAIIPTLSTDLPLAPAADAIALVGLFALARVFASLAAMDVGTAFGSMGARREMLIGFLAEPALLMVLFTASLISGSTSLPTIVETLAHR